MKELSYTAFFARLSGAPAPYAYQARVRDHLVAGHNVLLTAPTGCGKTWATVAAFLHGKATGSPIADRLFYALPLRALASSLKKEVEQRCRAAGVDMRVSIQTGAEADDELFDRGDIIFTTIDQLLSAYIHTPVSLPARLANLNAGAIVGSLVVFDEAHLLEADGARRTMVHLLRRLDGLAQVVIATATLTRGTRALLGTMPRMLEEGPTRDESAAIPVLAQKERRWTRVDRPLTPDDVAALHGGQRTLCVVNSVDQAQEIGAHLLASPPMGATVVVLHARFLPGDRARIEAELSPMFGPAATQTNVILVATQVVEAGLDLSADLLVTELAPANALVQRAGRCARYTTPRNTGDVFVFQPRANARGEWRLGPYRDEKEAVLRTWQALERLEGTTLGASGEHELLESALEPDERDAWQSLLSPTGQRITDDEVREAWQEGDASSLRRLVRDVQSVAVFGVDDPGAIDLRRGPCSIGLAMPTWRGFLQATRDEGRLPDVRKLVEASEPSGENPGTIGWSWLPVASTSDYALAFALPTTVAGYDPRLGLVLGRPGPAMPIKYRERPAGLAIHYSCEGYRDHVARIVTAARSWLARHPVAIERAAAHFSLPRAAIEQTILLAAALHDVAKLNADWQEAAKAWQRRKGELSPGAHPVPEEPVAHTDFDPRTDREHERKFRRPPHAVEGALASIETIDDALSAFGLDEERHLALRRIGVTAIARHHSPKATQHGDFLLIGAAADTVASTLTWAGLPSTVHLPPRPTPEHQQVLEDDLLTPVDDFSARWWPLYGLVVRALRLSDQAATKASNQGNHPQQVAEAT